MSLTKTVLVAEDNADLAEALHDFLAAKGYQVVLAMSGDEVLTSAELHKPSLFLMDIELPKMSGIEVITRLRGQERFAKTPIIALSAHINSAMHTRCMDAGANLCLSKPYGYTKLADLIDAHLGSN